MIYPFDTSEILLFEFEGVLKEHGVAIQNGSDLERVSLIVLETSAKRKKEIAHDNALDIRTTFSDYAGIIELANKIVKHKEHPSFSSIVPHLKLLNSASTPVMTSRSRITDDGNNKLMELYFALLCMSISNDVVLDDPNNSKGDNPDIMFTFMNLRWAIACKAMHSPNEKTLYDTIVKGTDQIEKSAADRGIVIVNYKNIIDRNQIWPIVNPEAANKKDEDLLFVSFQNVDEPAGILRTYGQDSQTRLMNTIGAENLARLRTEKCPAAFTIFLQAMTSVRHNGHPAATILKTLNLVLFERTVDSSYQNLVNRLNEAMHDRVMNKYWAVLLAEWRNNGRDGFTLPFIIGSQRLLANQENAQGIRELLTDIINTHDLKISLKYCITTEEIILGVYDENSSTLVGGFPRYGDKNQNQLFVTSFLNTLGPNVNEIIESLVERYQIYIDRQEYSKYQDRTWGSIGAARSQFY